MRDLFPARVECVEGNNNSIHEIYMIKAIILVVEMLGVD